MVAKLNSNSLETIHGWTIVLYGHAKPIAQAISVEKFHGYQLICKNHETSIANDLQYTVYTIIGPIIVTVQPTSKLVSKRLTQHQLEAKLTHSYKITCLLNDYSVILGLCIAVAN